MLTKKRRKYVVIAKVESDHFVKYRFTDIDKVIKFLTNKYPGLKYMNIYSNNGEQRGKMLYTWGKHKGLEPSR